MSDGRGDGKRKGAKMEGAKKEERGRLLISDFRLQTSDFRLQTSDFRLQTSDFRLQTSDFRLQTSDFGQQMAIWPIYLFPLRLPSLRLCVSIHCPSVVVRAAETSIANAAAIMQVMARKTFS